MMARPRVKVGSKWVDEIVKNELKLDEEACVELMKLQVFG